MVNDRHDLFSELADEMKRLDDERIEQQKMAEKMLEEQTQLDQVSMVFTHMSSYLEKK